MTCGPRGVTFEEYDIPGHRTGNGMTIFGDRRANWFFDTGGNVLALGATV